MPGLLDVFLIKLFILIQKYFELWLFIIILFENLTALVPNTKRNFLKQILELNKSLIFLYF